MYFIVVESVLYYIMSEYKSSNSTDFANILKKLGYSFRQNSLKLGFEYKKIPVSPLLFSKNLEIYALDTTNDNWIRFTVMERYDIEDIANVCNYVSRNKVILPAIKRIAKEHNKIELPLMDQIKPFIVDFLNENNHNIYSKYFIKLKIEQLLIEHNISINDDFDKFVGRLMAELHYYDHTTTINKLLPDDQLLVKSNKKIKIYKNNKIKCFKKLK